MWVGLIQSVEGLKSQDWSFLEKKEFCLKIHMEIGLLVLFLWKALTDMSVRFKDSSTRNVIKFIVVRLFPGMLSSFSGYVTSRSWVQDSSNLSATPALLLTSAGSCVGRAPTGPQSPYPSNRGWGAGCVMVTPLLRACWEGQMSWCIKSSETEHELDKE